MRLSRDWTFYLALAAAPLFWAALYALVMPNIDWSWPGRDPLRFLWPALFYPIMEEVIFRGFLQEWLRDRLSPWSLGPISHANLYTSLVFTALHFIHHPPLWAASVIFPSLVFGYFKDRTGTLAAPILLHVFYNAGYLWLFAGPV
jgi:membrane protease YdiL (CAAX protease family)